MDIKIPIYQPALSGNEKKYVNDCLDSSWISSKGKYVSEFEIRFAEYIDVNYATTVSNGTVAIHLALLALGIGEDDEVIVPTFTYIASVNAITYTGAKVVFVDSLKDTWQIDPVDVQAKITPKTKAVMAVHLYGHPCEMDTIVSLCKKHHIFLVEDCAEAFGSYYKGKHVGTFGDISTFSFFGNKTITTGEGGMVVTNSETIHSRAVHLKGQGLAKHRQYWHDIVGYNYRMTNICAAIGLAQLEQADIFLEKKKNLVKMYQKHLDIPQVTFHKEIGDVVNSYWMISILVSKSEDRDKLRSHLADLGIETRPLFYPVHTMPMYSSKFQKFENAEFLGWHGINLPSFPDLAEVNVIQITNAIKKYYGKVEILKIEKKDDFLVQEFIDNAGLSLHSFRYFNSRSLDVLKNHICTLILSINNKAIGYGHLDKENDDIWLGVAIIESQMGKGYGKMIMNKLLEIAKHEGVPKILLTVDNINISAMNMYRKYGFQKVKEYETYTLFELKLF